MSTTINVTVDDGGLPAKNRQQTAANRQAFVQGQASQQAAQRGADQRAADRRAAGLDPATGLPLPSAGATSRLPRIDQEPAANRRGGLSIAHVWQVTETTTSLATSGLFGAWDGIGPTLNVGQIPGPIVTGLRRDVAIGSGDASFWLPLVFETGVRSIPDGTVALGVGTYTFIANGVANFNTNASLTGFLLPLGKRLSILTLVHAFSYYQINRTATIDFDGESALVVDEGTATLVGAAAERTYRTFLVGEKTVREIETPETYLNIVHAEFPPGNTTRTVREGGFSTSQEFTIPAFGARTVPEGTLTAQLDPYYRFGATPLVFRSINLNAQELLPPDQVPSTPTQKRYAMPDVNRGAYQTIYDPPGSFRYKDAYQAGLPLYYARWPFAGQEPDITPGLSIVSQPSATQLLSLARPDYSSESEVLTLRTATDWDDPAYCRRYLNALGFSNADLTP